METLQRVFGIVGICPVVIYEDQGFEQMAKDVVSYMKDCHPDYSGTFKVYTRRARKYYPVQFYGSKCGNRWTVFWMNFQMPVWMYIVRS